MSAETEIFTVGASAYVKAEARRLFGRLWWLPAIIIAVPVCLGFSDSRFLYLALMLLFIVYPMFSSMAWLTLAAKPTVQWLSRPQRWRQTGDSLVLEFFPFDISGDEIVPLKTISVSADDVLSVADSGKLATVRLKKDNTLKTNFLLIPSGLISLDFLITDNEI